jgi:hypothetical protein
MQQKTKTIILTFRIIYIKRKVELFVKNQNLDFKPFLKIVYNQKMLDFCINFSYYIYLKRNV